MLMTQRRIHVQQRYLVLNQNYSPLQLIFPVGLKKKHFKANPGKSHVLHSTKKPEIISSNGIPFAASSHKRLLGVTTDSVLKLENYITKICLKVRIKLNTFCCISSSCH